MTDTAEILTVASASIMRKPSAGDGLALHSLVRDCPPLDENSVYCNLLQCAHFNETSVVADSPDGLLGFITGYLIPSRPDTLFVWQVAIDEQARGQGLATRMLKQILDRPICDSVVWLETTVTEVNKASMALFQGLAAKLQKKMTSEILFDQIEHFGGKHDSEFLLRIGPIN
ncbi:MAG: L-2,4-diaminobutyric acid acetyltransferase [Gammaproteobacteria bacterium]|jgi:L-2,4-diaminobutyric acid acetyltransferase